ncbi:MAG: MoxR family ATPase [Lachnospiraceae bacterium]|nr:MoxR family ATPase [Lachnospiraceae bacterium]
MQESLDRFLKEMGKVMKGKDEILKKIWVILLAKGHVLLEDVPGVGKTTMAMALAKTTSLDYKRTQFTPDVLPSDITGFSMYHKEKEEFSYMEGAVMCNIYLADEVNRTSPKTQSALLEVMEEGTVTVDKVTRKVPQPFFVIATQNPFGSLGTQKLPESQLDRFMAKLSIGYPEREFAIEMLKENGNQALEQIIPAFSKGEILELQNFVKEVYVDESIYGYITDLTEATRSHEGIEVGISPRGSLALFHVAKATAFVEGRNYVLPEDVQFMIEDVFVHRLVQSGRGRAMGIETREIVQDIVAKVPIPKLSR